MADLSLTEYMVIIAESCMLYSPAVAPCLSTDVGLDKACPKSCERSSPETSEVFPFCVGGSLQLNGLVAQNKVSQNAKGPGEERDQQPEAARLPLCLGIEIDPDQAGCEKYKHGGATESAYNDQEITEGIG